MSLLNGLAQMFGGGQDLQGARSTRVQKPLRPVPIPDEGHAISPQLQQRVTRPGSIQGNLTTPFDRSYPEASIALPKPKPVMATSYTPRGAQERPRTDYNALLDNQKPILQQIASERNMPILDKVSHMAEYVNYKTYGTALRALQEIGNGVRNLPTRIGEALDPNDAESRGDRLLDETTKRYGLTPQFRGQVHNANPTIVGKIGTNGNLNKGASAAGVAKSGGLHRIELEDLGAPSKNRMVMLHEGLHDTYRTLKDDTKSAYDRLLNQALQASKDQLGPKRQLTPTSYEQDVIKPGLKTYLQLRTRNYRSSRASDFSDVKYIRPDLRNELHSYVPEYYEHYKLPMPEALKNYYANYYNTGGRATPISRKNGFEQLIERVIGD